MINYPTSSSFPGYVNANAPNVNNNPNQSGNLPYLHNGSQIGDGEQEPGSQSHYGYRLNGVDADNNVKSVEVQSFWSEQTPDSSGNAGAFIVPDGNWESIYLQPIWNLKGTINLKNYRGPDQTITAPTFTGDYNLVIKGDQASPNEYNTITVNANDTQVQVNLDGTGFVLDRMEDQTGHIQNIVVEPGSGTSTINIQSLAADQTVSIQSGDYTSAGGNANDTVIIGNNGDLSGMLGTVYVSNSSVAGSTTLNINDSQDSVRTPRRVTMEPSTVSFFGLGTVNFDPSKMTAVTVSGGPYGNTFNILGTGGPYTTTINTGSGEDTVNVAPQNQNLDALAGPLTVNGGGATQLVIDDQKANTTDGLPLLTQYTLTGTTLTRVSQSLIPPATISTIVATITYDGLAGLTLNTGATLNQVHVEGTSTATTVNAGSDNTLVDVSPTAKNLDGLGGVLTVHGGGATQLVIDDQNNPANETYTITDGAFQRTGSASITYDGLAGLTLNTGANPNVVHVEGTSTATTVNAGKGNTLVDVSPQAENLDDLDGVLTVHGGGATQLVIDDQNNPANETYTITDGTFQRTGSASITYSGLSSLSVNGGHGADRYIIGGTSTGVATNINGGAGINTLVGANVPSTWNITGTNAGHVGGVAFSNVQNLTGGSSNDTFVFGNGQGVTGTIDGGGGTNTLDYSAYTTAVTVNLVTGTATGTGGVVNIEDVILPPVVKAKVTGAPNGGDTFTLAAWMAAGTTITGFGANNTLVGANVANIWTLTGANAGNVNGIAFTGISNLTGGTSSDTFQFDAGGSVSGTINGGGGTNTLNYSAYTTAVTSNLQTGAETGIGGGVANIGTLVGGRGSNTLVGPDANETWNITGMNAGNVAGVTFSAYQNLTGGAGNDSFVFSNGQGVTGRIDGGGGSNTLDYYYYTSGVTFNCQTGTATGVGGVVANIEWLGGGWGSNTLIGRNADETWDITNPNDGHMAVAGVTFWGFQNLIGGADNDTFVFVNGKSVTGTIDGGGGTNKLDYSAYTPAVTVDLATHTATGTGGVANIEALVGGRGSNTLVGPDAKETWNITGTNAGNVAGVTFSGFQNLTGGARNDSFAFGDGQGVTGMINGGGGSNELDYAAYTSGVTVDCWTGTATGTGGVRNAATLVGGRGSNTLIGLNNTNTNETWYITGLNAGHMAVTGVTFSGFQNLIGGGGNDTFVFSNGQGVTGTINGGGGTDKLDFSAYTTNLTWDITGTNAGTVGGVSFSYIQNLTGGSGVDKFVFGDNGNVMGTIDGGPAPVGQGNSLDYSGEPWDVQVNLATGATMINYGASATVKNIQNVRGGSGNGYNRLFGPDADETWDITGLNAGTVAGVTFSGFRVLIGGSGNDTFVFGNGQGSTEWIDGGGGTNTLDYSAYTTAVTVNLTTGAATGVRFGVTNIQIVRGGSGTNTITGDAQGNILIGGPGTNTITGGSGRSILIADKGAGTVKGGSGDDIVIGGYTNYDASSTANDLALEAILAEWQSADSYTTRISKIKAGLPGGYKLVWGTTVYDNGQVDTLTGGGGMDWFFEGAKDTITDYQSGEQIN
jgi:hypothetical protein